MAKYGIFREARDAFAASSQQKAAAAIAAGRFRIGDGQGVALAIER